MVAGNPDPGKLSTQYINDCMHQGKTCGGSLAGVNGCCGGDVGAAFEWIKKQGGIPTAADYGDFDLSDITASSGTSSGAGSLVSTSNGPTRSGNAATTQFTCKQNVPLTLTVEGSRSFDIDETVLENQLCHSGPVAISVATEGWNTYKGGVLEASACGSSVDHAVVLVGVSVAQNAWIVKNQWGKDWGVHSSGSPTDHTAPFQYCYLLKEAGYSYTCSSPATWQTDASKTWADFCPETCHPDNANQINEGAGYIFLRFGSDTCALTSSPVVPSARAAAVGATTYGVAAESTG
jgi:hypothetical protein